MHFSSAGRQKEILKKMQKDRIILLVHEYISLFNSTIIYMINSIFCKMPDSIAVGHILYLYKGRTLVNDEFEDWKLFFIRKGLKNAFSRKKSCAHKDL